MVSFVQSKRCRAAAREMTLRLTEASDGRSSDLGMLVVPDVQGSYRIPYIQSDPALRVRLVRGRAWRQGDVALRLSRKGRVTANVVIPLGLNSASFDALPAGNYVLDILGPDGLQRRVDRVGIGTVLAAVGDSLTEGYFSRGFKLSDLDLTAEAFPRHTVSRDRRNFPQFSPTTAVHKPDVNCFESWMTSLNNRLSRSWRRPVFIANEGWGGITSEGYLRLMVSDQGWRQRMRLLQPCVWLIHLGVNDERAQVTAADFRRNLDAIVSRLIRVHKARPECIFVARPSYDYWPGAPELLSAYGEQIDRLIRRRGLSAGPDFFRAFSRDRERWYGADPVHPGLAGMRRMAELWQRALVKQFPEGVTS